MLADSKPWTQGEYKIVDYPFGGSRIERRKKKRTKIFTNCKNDFLITKNLPVIHRDSRSMIGWGRRKVTNLCDGGGSLEEINETCILILT